ncbi:MAG: DUF58 domain-containing protein [Candidatus Omnitrophica bacterium]|nr:DUF58 domain-containing protein [Candidatus Omnitrophota bacterium]
MPNEAWLTPELIRHLEVLQLSVRWVRSGHTLGGRFPINRRGSSVEFADYTPYCAGDDFRAIDWNLYARLDRLYIKTYKEEIALSVELLIDATASMGVPDLEKFKRCRQIAICLAYVALAEGHRARLSWIQAGRILSSPWFSQRRDLSQMVMMSGTVHPQDKLFLPEWLRRAAIALRIRGGQAILLTDGLIRPAEFFEALHVLMIRNMEIKVIQVLSPQELHPARFFRSTTVVDAETGLRHQLAYSPQELEQAMASHNEHLARFCKRNGILFVQHRLDESLESLMTRTLPAHGFLE